MYRVMIIDDEIAVRKRLQETIAWEALGLEVVGVAASGIEAINVIDDVNPDIVFVDICMPFMNGIEFTRVATTRYPDLMVIVLTGFDDFEYARQCVSLPVVEYMLKPIVRKDVEKILKKVVEKIDKRKTESEIVEAEEEGINSYEVQQIAIYLRENYKDSTINLTSVAQQFGFNACYLSRKFKREMGMSFLEYLMKCRMERAIELKKSSYKMFETANEVGIPDPNYFGRCFKKYTGISYSEYV
ncbi:MAG: response regulator [Lachnospiraceae bacterium]|nr:response regulator [Lachnospiraceae bacterium]